MKYENIYIPENITQTKGIKPINIKRLPNVIAFIGKNGSGKTRILDLIENNPYFLDTKFEYIPNEIQALFNKLDRFKKYEHLRSRNKGGLIVDGLDASYQMLKKEFSNNETQETFFSMISAKIKEKYIRRIKQEEISSLQQALEESAEMKSFEEIIENVGRNVNYNELTSINKGAFRYLINLPHKLVADENECMGDKNKLHSRASYKRFDSLRKYLLIFLNKELEWDRKSIGGKYLDTPEGGYNVTYHGYFKLNKREFKYDEFSDGEKILFSYALFFFMIEQNQKLNIKEGILIIDEPELHLHADSEIELIGKLREMISEKGQLIIATHSINILSALNYEEIFLVKNSEIFHPSQHSLASSLSELIGVEEKINKLSDLLHSRDNWAFINFISQCFSSPDVIKTTDENDPQLISIKKMLKTIRNIPGGTFLDFGAGKGRIIKELLYDKDLSGRLRYSAFEPNAEHHPELDKLGIKVYTDYAEIANNSFDFILLSNVLHEISIVSWEELLNKIIDSLRDNGYLMIVEPKVLSKGEKIDDSGFIVLTEKEIQVLFELPYEAQSFFIEGFEDKITSVIIQKPFLKKVNRESIIKTLDKVQENSIVRAKELMITTDEKISDYARGRKMAFWAMQSMNAQLCLNKLLETQNMTQVSG